MKNQGVMKIFHKSFIYHLSLRYFIKYQKGNSVLFHDKNDCLCIFYVHKKCNLAYFMYIKYAYGNMLYLFDTELPVSTFDDVSIIRVQKSHEFQDWIAHGFFLIDVILCITGSTYKHSFPS